MGSADCDLIGSAVVSIAHAKPYLLPYLPGPRAMPSVMTRCDGVGTSSEGLSGKGLLGPLLSTTSCCEK